MAISSCANKKMEVHKLHGGTCYCGTPKLKDAAKQLEIAIKSNDKATDRLYKKLCKEIKAVQQEFAKLEL